MELIPIIGLEIHIQMKTKSKMFSSAPNTYGLTPNTMTSSLDFAFPGTMPTVNKEAVIHALRVAHALNMSLEHELHFDRKNYFYSDLPKGYQITQEERPLGRDGYINIKDKQIRIKRLHIEEDTCKQTHTDEHSYLDFNRAGIPLLEIVTLPDIRSAKEAVAVLEKIRSIVSYLDVSDGKMEEGSLRCDVNISLKDVNSETLNNKVEIKNLNSLSNMEKAINYEIKRQKELLLHGEEIKQETRRYDENKKETTFLRIKVDAIDYKYFPDPNIIPIKLSADFINEVIATSSELAEARYNRYLSYGLKEYDASLLVMDKDISDYYDLLIKEGVNYKLAANWMNEEVRSYLNKQSIDIKHFPLFATDLADLLRYIEKEEVSNKQAREIFARMIKEEKTSKEIIETMNVSLISNENEIRKLVNEILDSNPQTIIDFKAGKDRALGYIVGEVLKRSKGQANPKVTTKLVHEEIIRR